MRQVDSNPLVSIGLPTYNRAHLLTQAAESVLAQDYTNIELIISDNASTDGTRNYCEELCRQDARVRYIPQPTNLGPWDNHIAALKGANGDFFMFLGDDDWIDRSYVSGCLQFLLIHRDYVLASGRAYMFAGTPFYIRQRI